MYLNCFQGDITSLIYYEMGRHGVVFVLLEYDEKN